jgi:hypothetical protein
MSNRLLPHCAGLPQFGRRSSGASRHSSGATSNCCCESLPCNCTRPCAHLAPGCRSLSSFGRPRSAASRRSSGNSTSSSCEPFPCNCARMCKCARQCSVPGLPRLATVTSIQIPTEGLGGVQPLCRIPSRFTFAGYRQLTICNLTVEACGIQEIQVRSPLHATRARRSPGSRERFTWNLRRRTRPPATRTTPAPSQLKVSSGLQPFLPCSERQTTGLSFGRPSAA